MIDRRRPALTLLLLNAFLWARAGLAFKRAGRFADAKREYEAGLAYLADTSKPIGCDHPAWWETVRIYLICLCLNSIKAADVAADATRRSAALSRTSSSPWDVHGRRVLHRLFEAQRTLLASTGDSEVICKTGAIRSCTFNPQPKHRWPNGLASQPSSRGSAALQRITVHAWPLTEPAPRSPASFLPCLRRSQWNWRHLQRSRVRGRADGPPIRGCRRTCATRHHASR